jgi:hypothetical protein
MDFGQKVRLQTGSRSAASPRCYGSVSPAAVIYGPTLIFNSNITAGAPG